jgi:hypothetical protein
MSGMSVDYTPEWSARQFQGLRRSLVRPLKLLGHAELNCVYGT